MTNSIDIAEVHSFILQTLDGVAPLKAWGEQAYFYNPNLTLKRGTYFATIKEKDGDNDRASRLDRPGAWRLNFGVRRKTFEGIFGGPPARPPKSGVIEGPWDFSEKDILTPHPIYGWMCWLAVVNPSAETWQTCKPLILDAHSKAAQAFAKRLK
jgi:Family of unknown function (DUF6194)